MSTFNENDLPFDITHFEKQKLQGKFFSIKETFEQIHQTNHWSGEHSVSGEGSAPEQTTIISRELPALLKRFDIQTMIDAPCGDFNWMAKIALPVVDYLGIDIVPAVAEKNQRLFGRHNRRFICGDITADPLPTADLLFCRDCLVHLSYSAIGHFFENLLNSEIHYLMTTTFTDRSENRDITTGDWRPLNFEAAPFQFPTPVAIINEGCTEANGKFADKSLAMWRVETLRPFINDLSV